MQRQAAGAAVVVRRALIEIGWFLSGSLLLAGCQPRAGLEQPTAHPTYPAVAPAGIPPVTGHGVLAVVAANSSGAILPVTADLGNDWVLTVLVPADPIESIAVRIQRLPIGTGLSPSPAQAGETALTLSVTLFDADTGSALQRYPTPLTAGLRAPNGVDPRALSVWQLDEPTGLYQSLTAAPGAEAGVVGFELPRNGTLALGIGSQPEPFQASLSAPSDRDLRVTPTARAVLTRAPLPARLMIPSIGVNAPIAPVGLEASGIMASPSEGHVVGWYELGPRPGEPSNAVLAGHVDWEKAVAVFFRLRELKPGDDIEVRTSMGTYYRYAVDQIQSYRTEDTPVSEVFGPTAGRTLTLITCGGQFDWGRREYLERLVVRASGT